MGLQVTQQETGLGPGETSPSAALRAAGVGCRRRVRLKASDRPLWTLWCSCLLVFLRLGVTDSSGNEKRDPPSFCGGPSIYLLKAYCAFEQRAKPSSTACSQAKKLFMVWLLPHVLSHSPGETSKDSYSLECFSPAPKPLCLIGLAKSYSHDSRVKSFMEPSPYFSSAGCFVLQYDLVNINKKVYFILCHHLFILVSLQMISPLRAEGHKRLLQELRLNWASMIREEIWM